MIINISGLCDKRPIVYTLLSALSPLGNIALFTNDKTSKRLIEDKTDMGNFGDTLILYTNKEPREVWNEIQMHPNEFTHVLYVTDMTNVEDADLSLYITGSMPDKDEIDFLELFPNYKRVQLQYAGDSAESKSVDRVPIDVGHLYTIECIERYRKKASFKNKKLNQLIASLLEPHLGIPASTINKYINQKNWR